MKKSIFLAMIMMTTISCKKDYVCECDVTWAFTGATNKQEFRLEKTTKKEAKAECDRHTSSVSQVTFVCNLK